MRRKNLIFGLLVVGLLGVLPLAYWLLLEEQAPPPPPPPPLPEIEVVQAVVGPVIPESVAVLQVKGKADVRRRGVGPWSKLAAGDQLATRDEIRTGPGAQVKLRAADHTLVLVPETRLSVGELKEELSDFLLGKGMVKATADGPRKIRFGAVESDVEVTASQGEFEMASNGRGTVAVASLKGEVRVAARGEAVVLHGGTQTLVRKGRAPEAPRPIVRDLLLRVKWPAARRTNRKAITVKGKTRPGALVFVGGSLLQVDDQGKFSTRVELKEGKNRVTFQGMGVGGAAAFKKSPVIMVDTKGAHADFDTRKLWDK